MTIGLTALVERYLTERRILGFQLRSTAYSLCSLAEFVRRTRHRGPLTLEVMAEWARLDSHAGVDPRTKRIRHYGLLSAAIKTERLAKARDALTMPAANVQAREDAAAFLKRVAGIEIACCPHYRLGRWRTIEVLQAKTDSRRADAVQCRGPP